MPAIRIEIFEWSILRQIALFLSFQAMRWYKALQVNKVTAVKVKIPKVIRPRSSSAKVIKVNPATKLSGDITKWTIPRNLGFFTY